jgi:hypothetical protein
VRGILLALVATLVGLAMVGGGIYGLVKGDDDDDSSSASASSDPTKSPGWPFASVEQCEEVGRRDPRLRTINDLEMEPSGKETGTADVRPVCNGPALSLSFDMDELRTRETSSYYVWLYKDSETFENIGSLIGSDGDGFGSATLTADVDTSAYDQIVITRAKFGASPPSRPKKIVFAGSL